MIELNKPKIILITSRADFGGGPEHIFNLIKVLKNDIDFFVACPDDYPYWNRYEKILGKDKLFKILHRKINLKIIFSLKDFIKKNKIQFVHSHGKGAGLYSRILNFIYGIPCIHTFHGFHIGEYNFIQKRIYILLEKILAIFTKTFITVSKSEFELISSYKISKIEKIRTINNGVDIPAEKVNEEIFNKNKLKVITITRFDYAKNTLLLVDIIKELKNQNKINLFEFVILGSGSDEKNFRKRMNEENISDYIKLFGFVENTSEFLIDAFCYISTSRWEGLPLGIMEAMSYGVPVIATNVTGNKDLVENNKNGYLYNINNSKEAVEYIVKLSEDKKLWKDLSDECRLNIENKYSLEKMGKETKLLYMEYILNKK